MILNYANQDPIHVIGTSVATHEIKVWLEHDTSNNILTVAPEKIADLPFGSNCVLGFWNLDCRKKFIESCDIEAYNWPIYVHPKACVHDPTLLSPGSVIYPMCQIAYQVITDKFLIIAAMATIGHGAILGKNVVISPGVSIGGGAQIGDHVLFGQQASVKDKIRIGNDTKFAMNSVVTQDILEPGNYYCNKRANIQF